MKAKLTRYSNATAYANGFVRFAHDSEISLIGRERKRVFILNGIQQNLILPWASNEINNSPVETDTNFLLFFFCNEQKNFRKFNPKLQFYPFCDDGMIVIAIYDVVRYGSRAHKILGGSNRIPYAFNQIKRRRCEQQRHRRTRIFSFCRACVYFFLLYI